MENVLPSLVEMEQEPQYLLVENVAGFEVCNLWLNFQGLVFFLTWINLDVEYETESATSTEVSELLHCRISSYTATIRDSKLKVAILSTSQEETAFIF